LNSARLTVGGLKLRSTGGAVVGTEAVDGGADVSLVEAAGSSPLLLTR
jgi:hypothetical protein